MQDDLIERLKMHRIILKSGDYNGADLMAAWCDMMNAANQGKEDNDRIAALEAKLAKKDAQLAEALAENARLLASVKGWAADAARLNDNADYWRQECHRLRETLAGEQPWN